MLREAWCLMLLPSTLTCQDAKNLTWWQMKTWKQWQGGCIPQPSEADLKVGIPGNLRACRDSFGWLFFQFRILGRGKGPDEFNGRNRDFEGELPWHPWHSYRLRDPPPAPQKKQLWETTLSFLWIFTEKMCQNQKSGRYFQIAPCYEEVLYTLGSVHCYTPSNTWCNILEVQKWTMKAGRVTRKIITRDTLVDSI